MLPRRTFTENIALLFAKCRQASDIVLLVLVYLINLYIEATLKSGGLLLLSRVVPTFESGGQSSRLLSRVVLLEIDRTISEAEYPRQLPCLKRALSSFPRI